jgi:uncharacterized protein (TIGR02453 family)
MIQADTLKFLKALNKNNNKQWFDVHRDQYETAKSDFSLFVEQMIKAIAAFDPPIGNLVAKNCMFRINRDVRFSKDKRPYKNNFAGYFNAGGKKSNGAGYYFHLESGNSFLAGGLWMPQPADLAKIRQEIDYCFTDWKKLTGSAGFKKQFPEGLDKLDTLVRPPKGYDELHPAIEFLKLKSFIVRKSVDDTEILQKGLVSSAANAFKTMKPMIDFLNNAVEPL